MPIEDVDFLKRNSKKESYVFLVDSGERDRTLYPTPSSYVIGFTTPFQYVVGLDVVDASIPRTQYNVDLYNNTLSFMIHDDTLLKQPLDTTKMNSVTIEPGDYSIQTLIPKLNEALQDFVMSSNYLSRDRLKLDTALGCNVLYSRITAAPYSSPPETTNLIQFTCPYPFALDMKAATMSESIGFDLLTQTSESARPPLQQRYEVYNSTDETAPNQQLYHSVDIDPNTQIETTTLGTKDYVLGESSILFEGPRGIIDRLKIPFGGSAAQSFVVENSRTYLTQVSGAFAGIGNITWEIRTDTGGAIGQPSTKLVATGAIHILNSDGTLDPSSIIPKPSALLTRGKYWIVFSAPTRDDDVSLLYNDVVAPTDFLIYKLPNENAWTMLKIGGTNATASILITTADEYHTVVSPGTYNFIGERYIVLRCPEIEEHSYRSLAYSKYFLGLAMFRLGVVGLSDNQVNNVKVPTREFHPVGKLSRLTFKFETINGQPYDFKGVNHTVTLALHYLVPHSTATFERSIINPNYNGNYIEYMFNQEDQEGDSDDHDEEYSRDVLANYRVQEMRHKPEMVSRLDREALFRARIQESQES